MPTYEIRIESTSDWSEVRITSAAKFVKGEGAKIQFSAGTDVGQPTRMEIENARVGLFQKQFSTGKLVATLQVETNDDRIVVRSEKGSVGTVKLFSPVDSVTNQESGGATNPANLTLAVRGPAPLFMPEVVGLDMTELAQPGAAGS